MGDVAMGEALVQKLEALEKLLRSWESVGIGYSGGVDSTFLALVCARALPDRTVLVRLDTPFAATPEQASVRTASRPAGTAGESVRASAFGLPLLEIPFDPFADEDVVRNDERRCYFCKRAGFRAIIGAARRAGVVQVVDGSNADDAGDYRPGTRALRELGIRSPLMETGWRKAEERAMLRAWGVPVWNMPAGACLATRVPTGDPLTPESLAVVRTCEDYLHGQGLQQVRARLMNGVMQIEAGENELRTLVKLQGSAPSGQADAAAAGPIELPYDLRCELEHRSGCVVRPVARPYLQGGMNA